LLLESVYDVQGPLHIKADDKKTWKRQECQLTRSSGLCCRLTPAGGGKNHATTRHTNTEMMCVQSLHDVDVYLAIDWRKKYKSPTEHGIALKVWRATCGTFTSLAVPYGVAPRRTSTHCATQHIRQCVRPLTMRQRIFHPCSLLPHFQRPHCELGTRGEGGLSLLPRMPFCQSSVLCSLSISGVECHLISSHLI